MQFEKSNSAKIDSVQSTEPIVHLASSSPQRRQLLAALRVPFAIVKPEIDESVLQAEEPETYVQRLALEKATHGARMTHACELPVLGADACVVCEGQILGKPVNEFDAKRMLRLLSGREHQVYTAIALVHQNSMQVECSCNAVEFGQLADRQIDEYWACGESEGRAGAYAIQGNAAEFINRLEGSYSAVVGLPVKQAIALLQKAGIPVVSYEEVLRNKYLSLPDSNHWKGNYWL